MKVMSFANLKGLEKSLEGLSSEQVIKQRRLFGKNTIVEVASNRWIEILKETIQDPMIWFLIGIGLVFLFIGQQSEAITLFIAILPLLLMDAFLHWRTQASTLNLKSNLVAEVSVIREGHSLQISSEDLVPGDIVKISSGSSVPADCIIEESQDVQVDESVLTGEAFPVQKKSCAFDFFKRSEFPEGPVDSDTLAFAGTKVLTGHGLLRVLWTGGNTSYGAIVQSVAKMPQERTPLQNSISQLVRILIYVSFAICLLLAGLRIYQGHGWLDALLSAATLAIAAIPEEFPVVFSFFLGVGIYRLAQKKALVRRAVSVENIGRITQICTDKTGTITTGELELTHFDPIATSNNDEVVFISAIASNAEGGDPVDVAIFKLFEKSKFKMPEILHRFPFTESRKCESAFFSQGSKNFCALKGSPETVLNLSALSAIEKEGWLLKTNQWAKQGHKVLACAKSEIKSEELQNELPPTSKFDFLGLLAFEDPARPEVATAVTYAYKNNIKVLMLTGDHLETAAAIGREVGLGGEHLRIASAETEASKFEADYLSTHPDFLKSLDVVARCTPLQKLCIVNALKSAGEVVAVTGDGVNDVPALKAADIGIAMGLRGTRSAKEVSSIILGDDNFKTIISAIMEGRQLFSNLQSSFKYLLHIHVPFVLTAAMIPLLGYPLVFLPVHIVWLELVIHPTAILAFQALATADIQKPSGSFISRSDGLRILLLGLGLALVIGIIFVGTIKNGSSLELARAKAMVVLSFWSALLALFYTRFKNLTSTLLAVVTIGITIIIIETPSAASLLHVEKLSLQDWFGGIILMLIAGLLLWLSEFLTIPSRSK